MAKKPAEITSDDVDNLTDEQIAELTESMRQEAPAEVADDAKDAAKDDQSTAKADDATDDTAKAAETTADDLDDDGREPEKTDKVDFKRYDYERNRRKEAERLRAAEKAELERRAEAEKAEWARRFDELLKASKGPQKQEEEKPQIPDEDEDPHGAIKWLKQELVSLKNQREQETAEQKAAREQNEQANAILAEAGNEFAAAVQTDPTIQEAYDALRQSFVAEAGLYGIPQHELKAYLDNTEFQHIAYARNNRIPLANYIKGMAQARGWAPKQTAPVVDENKTDEAQKRAKSLSNGGGSPGVSDSLTAEQILSMPEREFDALIEKYGSVAGALAAQ